MTRSFALRSALSFALASAILAGTGLVVRAQQPAEAPAPKPPAVPVRVAVVLSRYQGEKKVSSMPFEMLVTAIANGTNGNNRMSLRMGIDVPIGSTTTTGTEGSTRPSGSNGNTTSSTTGTTRTTTQYRNVGTDIDCYVYRLDDARYSVSVNLSDSSIYTPDGDKALRNLDSTAFRTFSTSNTVTLTNGQTILFGTATDKITGEILKIEVSLNVVR